MKKSYLLFFAILFLGVGISQGQVNVMHGFTSGYPYGTVTVVGNTVYGCTVSGGAHSDGCIFSMKTDGTSYKDIYDFVDSGTVARNYSGYYPYGNLTYLNGKLFGFTYYGGDSNEGTIFRINTDGTGYKDLWDFSTATGKNPYFGSLNPYGNKFFGTTLYGGANNDGAVFSIDTNGANYKDIFDFADTGTSGEEPYSSTLAIHQGKIYGTVTTGGRYTDGVLYSLDTNGTHYKDIYDFNNTDTTGSTPYGSVLLIGGKLFGTTYKGTEEWSYGTVYSIDTNGNNYNILHFFDYYDGDEPYCTLSTARGHLYGTTAYGDVEDEDDGVVFTVDTNGYNYEILGDFSGGNGEYPYGDIAVAGDTLWGMTYDGGFYDEGEIFNIIDTRIVASTNNISATPSAVSVYPNPSNGTFTFQTNNEKLTTKNVEVYNLLGENIYSKSNIQNSTFNIDLSGESAGVYLYRITTENGSVVSNGKLVIEK